MQLTQLTIAAILAAAVNAAPIANPGMHSASPLSIEKSTTDEVSIQSLAGRLQMRI